MVKILSVLLILVSLSSCVGEIDSYKKRVKELESENDQLKKKLESLSAGYEL